MIQGHSFMVSPYYGFTQHLTLSKFQIIDCTELGKINQNILILLYV